MKIIEVKVQGMSLKGIFEFSYQKSVNEHGTAILRSEIEENDYDEYVRKAATVENATIQGIDLEGNQETVFAGIVKNMQVMRKPTRTEVTIEVIGGTYLMDLERKTKPHQDSGETFDSLINELIGSYPGAKCDFASRAYAGIGRMYVQYEETDWEFAKRMASRLQQVIIPKPVVEGVYFEFGCFDNSPTKEVESVLEESVGAVGDFEECRLVSRDYLELGTKVIYDDKKWKVYAAKGNYENNVLMNEYLLRHEEDFLMEAYENDRVIGASLDATIDSVSADQVMVSILGDTPSKLFPYATIYSSPDGSGWYCMPEPQDKCRLYFPSSDEDEAYVNSSVNQPVSGGADSSGSEPMPWQDDVAPRSNPDHKSLKTKYGKEIVLAPEKILITNNDGMYVEINDAEGITLFSQKKIKIESDVDVNIISNQDSVNVIAKNQVLLKQNQTSIELNEDISMLGGRIVTQ